jgi:hypothetical protein
MTDDGVWPIEQLMQRGWPMVSAAALSVVMRLHKDEPPWRDLRLLRFRDWASAHERNPDTLEARTGYVDYELRNTYKKIGMELRATKTVQEALPIVKRYHGSWQRPCLSVHEFNSGSEGSAVVGARAKFSVNGRL